MAVEIGVEASPRSRSSDFSRSLVLAHSLSLSLPRDQWMLLLRPQLPRSLDSRSELRAATRLTPSLSFFPSILYTALTIFGREPVARRTWRSLFSRIQKGASTLNDSLAHNGADGKKATVMRERRNFKVRGIEETEN